MNSMYKINEQLTFEEISNEDINNAKRLLKENDLCYNDIPKENLDIFKVLEGNVIVGYLGLEHYGSDAVLRAVVIKDNFRGLNLGRTMTLLGIDAAKDMGIKSLYLLTLTAKDFFSKLGFKVMARKDVPEKVGKSEEFLNFCPDTAICMMLSL